MTESDAPDPSCRAEDEEIRAPGERGERPWLPDDASIVADSTFTAPSGRQYRVLRTTQSDAYDRLPDDQDPEDDAMDDDEHTIRDQGQGHTGSAGSGSAEAQTVRGAPFPHVDIPADASDGRNADRRPRAPEGPRRGPLGPTTRTTRPEPKEP